MRRHLVIAALAMGASGTAYAQDMPNDPFEPFNRVMFHFNEKVDEYALKPVALGYRAVTPRVFRAGVSNVLSNLHAPVVFANDVLQVAPSRAGATLARFGINTTIGVVGVFDVAKTFGIDRHSEDFGQTLGHWGVGAGPYLVLPFLGPSSVRDGIGDAVDVAFDPLNYAQFDGDDAVRITRGVLSVVSAREAGIEALDSLYATSIDPYVSIRSTYTILRESAVQNGQTNVQDLPEFEEIPSQPATEPSPAPSSTPPQGN